MNGTAKPYVVGMWCHDGTKGEHNVAAIAAVNEADASARAVSQYYMRGGKLPLVAMSVMQISEETARNALAMIEADKAMDKVAAEVVKPFSVVQGDPLEPSPDPEADRQPLPVAEDDVVKRAMLGLPPPPPPGGSDSDVEPGA